MNMMNESDQLAAMVDVLYQKVKEFVVSEELIGTDYESSGDRLAEIVELRDRQEHWDWAEKFICPAVTYPALSNVLKTFSELDLPADEPARSARIRELKNETFYHVYRMLRMEGASQTMACNLAVRFFLTPDFMEDGIVSAPFFLTSVKIPPPRLAVKHAVMAVGNKMKALESLQSVAMRRGSLISQLKATLFLMISRAQIVDAAANRKFLEPDPEKLGALVTRVGEVLRQTALTVSRLYKACENLVATLGRWYGNLPPDAQGFIDLMVISVFLYVLYSSYKKEYKIVLKKTPEPDRFIGAKTTETGVVYEVMIGGQRYSLPAVVPDGKIDVEEMAMPGSDYYPSSKRPVGAILVATETSDLQVFAVFWRYGEYFVTVRHAANALSSGTAKVYLASSVENSKGNYVLGRVVPALPNLFDLETNLVKDLTLDLFMVPYPAKEWARIGVTSASTKLASMYKQHISAVGFGDKGLLVTSTGATKEGSGPVELWHTASTRKGFSGSPIFCGSSVVGMHTGGSSEKNRAIRIEVIKDAVRGRVESSTTTEELYEEDYKMNGRSSWLEDLDDGRYAVMDKRGRVSYGWDEEDVRERFVSRWDMDEKDIDRAQDEYIQSTKLKFSKHHKYDDYDYYDTENAPLPQSKPKPELAKQKDTSYRVVSRERPGKGPQPPKPEPEVVQWLEEQKDKLQKLGYEDGLFGYPDPSPEAEELSLKKHLKLYHERAEMIRAPPTREEVSRCIGLLVKQLAVARYEPDVSYKSRENLEKIIHSSLIKPGKSSGYPHCENGMPNNEALLRQMGPTGLAQLALNEWDEPFWIKMFEKMEPHKRKKLLAEMGRLISGLPTHKLLKHITIFKNFTATLSENWLRSPIKFGFSPGNPGNIENLVEWLGRGEIVESDKTNWDYMFHGWCFDICKKVTMELADQPLGMSDEEFAEYLSDVSGAFDEIYKGSRLRTSSGLVYTPTHDGVMKSGWFLTIAINSMAQIVLNNIVLMRLGETDDAILNKHKIVAGGDDVLQKLDGVDLESYKKVAESLGMPITEFIIRPTIKEFEFFSHEMKYDTHRGLWTFLPVRFVKHIEHLKTTKVEDLPDALVSHMRNWRWSNEKFQFFLRMYKEFRVKYPELFTLEKLRTQRILQNEQLGYESIEW